MKIRTKDLRTLEQALANYASAQSETELVLRHRELDELLKRFRITRELAEKLIDLERCPAVYHPSIKPAEPDRFPLC